MTPIESLNTVISCSSESKNLTSPGRMMPFRPSSPCTPGGGAFSRYVFSSPSPRPRTSTRPTWLPNLRVCSGLAMLPSALQPATWASPSPKVRSGAGPSSHSPLLRRRVQ
jgi:hypothetical protein